MTDIGHRPTMLAGSFGHALSRRFPHLFQYNKVPPSSQTLTAAPGGKISIIFLGFLSIAA
jgi:hypothetical protein